MAVAEPAATPAKRIYDDLLRPGDIGTRTKGAWTSRAYDTTKRRMKNKGCNDVEIMEQARNAYKAAGEVWDAACS